MTMSTTTASFPQLTSMTSSPDREMSGMVSQDVSDWIRTVVGVWLCSLLSALGITTNALVIAVFAKQGFKDSMAISMTAIAVWDFLKCVCCLIGRLYWVMGLTDPPLGQMWADVTAILLTYLHSFMGFVSCALAAYVSTERCLCVSMPFKVKDIFTRKLTIIMMVVISTIVLGSFMVVFALWEVRVNFDPVRNTSTTTLVFSDFRRQHGVSVLLYYNIVSIFWPLLSFVVIVVSAVIITHHLQKSSEFRGKNVNSQESQMSARDLQVIKMLIVIIVVYIVNLFPRIVQYFARFVEPEFYLGMRYHNLFIVVINVVFIFDFVNASTNLFIFVTMSSNFRSTFVDMFGDWWVIQNKKDKC
ncbi:uncharacterized protein LOC101853782 [Aplysia californica]|uniref:Uncharacterized protein LOC101853782 n=1 Tax=Aplysia californica TaxID=6500 RepID=A0ABM0JLT1_APLCA|nr:uncharacterized protein LOC101853782 [Aplysia californica]